MKNTTHQNIFARGGIGGAVVALLLGVLLVGLSGCQGKELSAALRTYTVTLDQLTAARQAGHISDDTQRNVIAPAREATKALLDEAVLAYLDGRPFDFRATLVRIYDAMAPLLSQRAALENPGHDPPH